MIMAFIEDIRNDKIIEGLKLLAIHRRSLLDELHKKQKQIDCLDYKLQSFTTSCFSPYNALSSSKVLFVIVFIVITPFILYYDFIQY